MKHVSTIFTAPWRPLSRLTVALACNSASVPCCVQCAQEGVSFPKAWHSLPSSSFHSRLLLSLPPPLIFPWVFLYRVSPSLSYSSILFAWVSPSRLRWVLFWLAVHLVSLFSVPSQFSFSVSWILPLHSLLILPSFGFLFVVTLLQCSVFAPLMWKQNHVTITITNFLCSDNWVILLTSFISSKSPPHVLHLSTIITKRHQKHH